MDRKLTLSLNAHVIDKAKGYAKAHGTSLSKMVENYLSSVVNTSGDSERLYTPTVNRLMGVIELPDDYDDLKLDYADYLSEKYR